MFRVLPLCVLMIGGPLLTGSTWAQRSSRYFSAPAYQRLGLEQAWSMQVQLDSNRARADALVLQVVGLDSYERLQELVYRVFEVTYNGQSVRFSENDVDASGRRIGRDEAQRLAEKQMILLEARGLKPTLTTQDIPPTVLYAQSTAGTLHAMDAETGKTLWAATVGNPRWPSLSPAANDDFVATVNGSSLFLLHRATGELIWQRPVGMNPASALAMTASFVFVPGVAGQMEAYQLPTAEDDHRATVPWIYHAGGRLTAAPAVGATTVSWGTEDGRFFVADVGDPTMLYQFRASGSIASPARFLPPGRWVIASSDGYVTALNERTGAIEWDFATGADVDQPPLALAEATYVVTRQNELFCISSEDGLERWVTLGVEQVLACGKERLYVRGVGGTMVAIDRQTGERLGSLPASGYRIGLNNHLTDRIYLMSDSGNLLCLREQASPLPVIHVPLPQPATPRAERTPAAGPAAAGPTTATPPATAEDDMFGDDAFQFDEEPVDAEPADDAAADEPDAGDILDPSDEPVDAPAEDEAEAEEGTEGDDPFNFD